MAVEKKAGVDAEGLSLRENTKIVINRILNWIPPVPDWVPTKKTRNSSLRFATIVEDRLFASLEFEGEQLVLTPGNWKQVLQYAKPDLLLVESIWIGCTGHWHMGQHHASPAHAELVEIVEEARRLSIPAVFWITKGVEYHEHYREYARHFDAVFCVDEREVERLIAEGIEACFLPPCVQPALFNPFRFYDHHGDIGLNVLFDGWAALDRETENLAVLEKLKPFGLGIIESRYQLFRNRLSVLPQYRDHILGCVDQATKQAVLKYAKSYVTVDSPMSSAITQQWMSLEAAACRVPVVHLGRLADNDLRRDFVIECLQEQDFLIEFVRYHEDELYHERVAHLSWRTVNRKHTFSHRLHAICAKVGVVHDWVEYPKASLVTPTYRKEYLPNCLETFDRQSYENKELVLVFNGNELVDHRDMGLGKAREDVIFSHVPRDLFAGASLNMGHVLARGKYCFRIDDDDFYGENYILDMILQARSIDAGLFGKSSAPLFFEGEKGVYVRNETLSFVIAPQEALQTRELWFGGNSISGSAEFFARNNYSDTSYGAADTELVLNLPPGQDFVFAFMDRFNIAAERRQDVSSHTWKYDKDKLKEKCHKLKSLDELTV